MKKVALLIFMMVMALSFAGCQSSSIDTETDAYSNLVINIPWADSEQLSYQMEDESGDVIGKIVLTVEKSDEAYILGYDRVTDTTSINGFVAVDKKTLAPIVSSKIISSESAGATELDCSYEKNRVTVLMPVDAEDGSDDVEATYGSIVIAVPDVIYDNDEIIFLGRTLPLAEGYYAEIPNFVVTQFSAPVVSFAVTSTETITVPAGTFDCYKVRIGGLDEDSIQSVIWLWYGVKGTNPLVKYSVDGGSYILTG